MQTDACWREGGRTCSVSKNVTEFRAPNSERLTNAPQWLLYGANGYTGELIAREAKARGLAPILAGRNQDAIIALARELDLPYRVFGLDAAKTVQDNLREIKVVLHCAGPFSKTAGVMAEACLANGTHYLDITGEIGVFEMLHTKDRLAREQNVMLLPGVGFDVVPTDCLAAHLKRRLPTATHLELAWRGTARASQGTMLTALQNIGEGGAIRRDGKITRVPSAYKTREVDFGRGPTKVIAIPWGDVSTAFYSTGIPNIIDYVAFPPMLQRMISASRYFGGVLVSKPAQNFLTAQVKSQPAGPSLQERTQGTTRVWGEVRDAAGKRCVSRLVTPEAYQLTTFSALAAVQKVLVGNVKPGYQTPSLAFGSDFVMELPKVTREDIL